MILIQYLNTVIENFSQNSILTRLQKKVGINTAFKSVAGHRTEDYSLSDCLLSRLIWGPLQCKLGQPSYSLNIVDFRRVQ